MSGRILIAEDDTVLAQVVRLNLTHGGFDVVMVHDGLSAAELAEAERFDLIMTDHQMPGLTGLELIRRIRKDTPNAKTPIYFCSAKGYELDIEQIEKELNVTRVFIKPFSPRELTASIRTTIEDSQQTPSSVG